MVINLNLSERFVVSYYILAIHVQAVAYLINGLAKKTIENQPKKCIVVCILMSLHVFSCKKKPLRR